MAWTAGRIKKRIKHGGPDMLDLTELQYDGTYVSRILFSISVLNFLQICFIPTKLCALNWIQIANIV